MDTVTIACPIGMTDPNVDPETSPIYTDGVNDYHVASGQLEGGDALTPYITSEPIKAQPDRVNIVVGMSGLDALAAMGLEVKHGEDTSMDS